LQEIRRVFHDADEGNAAVARKSVPPEQSESNSADPRPVYAVGTAGNKSAAEAVATWIRDDDLPVYLTLPDLLPWWWSLRNPEGGPYDQEAALLLLRRCGADGDLDGFVTGVVDHDPCPEPVPIRRIWWRDAATISVPNNSMLLRTGLCLRHLEFDRRGLRLARVAWEWAKLGDLGAVIALVDPQPAPSEAPASPDEPEPPERTLVFAAIDDVVEALSAIYPEGTPEGTHVRCAEDALSPVKAYLKEHGKKMTRERLAKFYEDPRIRKRRVGRNGKPLA
jgi:hypothetical protein